MKKGKKKKQNRNVIELESSSAAVVGNLIGKMKKIPAAWNKGSRAKTMRLIARKRYWLVIISCPVLGPRKFFRLTHSILDQLMRLYSSAPAEIQRLFSSIVFVAHSSWILHVETKLFVGIIHWFLHFCIEKKSFCLELYMTDWPGGTSVCPALMLHQCLNRTRRKPNFCRNS